MTGGIWVFIPPPQKKKKSAQVNFLLGKHDVRTAIQQFFTPKKLLYPPKQISGYAPVWEAGHSPCWPIAGTASDTPLLIVCLVTLVAGIFPRRQGRQRTNFLSSMNHLQSARYTALLCVTMYYHYYF